MRKLMLSVAAILGFAATSCEEYEVPEIPNSGPVLKVLKDTTGLEFPATAQDFSGKVEFYLVAEDDKYVNSIGIYLFNTDEENSKEFQYGFTFSEKNKSKVDTLFKIEPVANKLINGNYNLMVQIKDVKGLMAEKVIPITISANASNVVVDSTDKYAVTAFKPFATNDQTSFFSIVGAKVYKTTQLTSSKNLQNIDIIAIKIGNEMKFFSQKEAKSLPVEAGFTPGSTMLDKSLSFVSTNLTLDSLKAVSTSTTLRRVYNNSGEVKSSVVVEGGKVFGVKTESGSYALVGIVSAKDDSLSIKSIYKRLF